MSARSAENDARYVMPGVGDECPECRGDLTGDSDDAVVCNDCGASWLVECVIPLAGGAS